MDESLDDVYHVTRDEKYLRQLDAEAAFFDRPHHFTIDAALPFAGDYLNERFSGDRKVPWFETIGNYGTFRRGCALGAGGAQQRSRILQQHPALHLTIFDISEESLAEMDRELGSRFPGRVATERADLNFVQLPPNTYDLIMSASCLHHLLNLEHVAYQINRSLVPGGVFFLYDYVGEARFQFAPEKKRLFESAFEEAKGRRAALRSWRIVWPDLSDWEYSPFEAARSDETLEILGHHLTEVSLRTAGGLLLLMLYLRRAHGAQSEPSAARLPLWRRRLLSVVGRLSGHRSRRASGYAAVLEQLAPELVPLDLLHTEAGALRPAVAFAVYKKKREGRPSG